ncbi:hypothetical protein EA187_16270 [Lujinxingia sediminis]|uniref:HEAT repeat domain-containing protein n=1 Tax=Lujinxingia sediminis TaxID=2480984 RepID=A0ABY0CPM9_9DELT|nr:hypothetical protein [Lujinxingia sediminis]RVU42432.1 hypothetical protein EA187_16270 [Lujinxingia sediminis]
MLARESKVGAGESALQGERLEAGRLARVVTHLLEAESLDDAALLGVFEELAARQPAFALLTGLWGPALYRRHRALYRGFILRRFRSAGYDPGRGAWRVAPWSGPYQEELERWLQLAESLEDAEVFRRLYRWRLTQGQPAGPKDVARWREDLCEHFGQVRGGSAGRRRVLERYDQPFELRELQALTLYRCDPEAARDYIAMKLSRVPVYRRRIWEALLAAARRRGDWPFARELYRLQVPPGQWRRDVEAISEHVRDPAELISWLEEHHPRGSFEEKGVAILALLRARGGEVLPYVRRHLGEAFDAPGGGALLREFLKEVAARRWWGLWARVLKEWAPQRLYEWEVMALLHASDLPDRERRRRLRLLGRVGDEAEVTRLSDVSAVALYARYPRLVRGVFAPRVMPSAVQGYPRLMARALQEGDEVLIDRMASALIMEVPRFGVVEVAEVTAQLTQYYRSLLSEPRRFGARVVPMLIELSSERRWRAGMLLKSNPLAHHLLVEALPAYLLDEAWLGALLRAPAWFVRRVGCQALCLGDEALASRRARQCARQAMPSLGARHRAERRWAARAVARGVCDEESARDALQMAQAVLDGELSAGQGDAELVRLVGRLSARWPQAAHQAGLRPGRGPGPG